MKIALYNKYRPGTFADLFGQEHVATTLKNAVLSGSFAHAYLFTGPRGTGKTTVARLIAKAINCDQGNKEASPQGRRIKAGESIPCGECDTCIKIGGGREVDIIEIDAASNRGIDEIRDLREKVKFSPTNLKYKVFIIDEVHMLTKEAFNALLKTLEEPPAHAVFVLATTEIHKIPQTIISRCQRFDFRRINIKDLIDRLRFIAKIEKIEISGEALLMIAEASEGGFRDAISYLDQISSFKKKIELSDVIDVLGMTDYKTLSEIVSHVKNRDAKSAVVLVNSLADNGYDMSQLSKNLVEYLRKLLLVKVLDDGNSMDLSESNLSKMKEIASGLSSEEILSFIEAVAGFSKTFQRTSLPQLPLELAIVKVVGGAEKQNNLTTEQPNNLITEQRNNLITEQPNNKTTGQPDTYEQPSNEKVDGVILQSKEEEDSGPVILAFDSEAQTREATSRRPESINQSGTTIDEPSVEISGSLGELWAEFLMEIKAKNPSLHAFVKVSEPSLTNEAMTLAFPYRFHKERVDDLKNRKVVEEILEMVYNKPYKLRCVLKKKLGSETKEAVDEKKELLDSALDIFGGEVVE